RKNNVIRQSGDKRHSQTVDIAVPVGKELTFCTGSDRFGFIRHGKNIVVNADEWIRFQLIESNGEILAMLSDPNRSIAGVSVITRKIGERMRRLRASLCCR